MQRPKNPPRCHKITEESRLGHQSFKSTEDSWRKKHLKHIYLSLLFQFVKLITLESKNSNIDIETLRTRFLKTRQQSSDPSQQSGRPFRCKVDTSVWGCDYCSNKVCSILLFSILSIFVRVWFLVLQLSLYCKQAFQFIKHGLIIETKS